MTGTLSKRMRWVGMLLVLTLMPLEALASDYIGVKAGWVYSHDACEGQAISCGKESTGGGLLVGYQVNDWLALEVGYDDLGNITADYPAVEQADVTAHYKGEMQGFELAAKPYWQLSENVTLFTKLGTLAWSMDVAGNEVGFKHSTSDDDWSLMLGTGVEYALGSNWSALLEYQWIDNLGGSSTGGTDVSMVSVGLVYHFGISEVQP
ncbi:MAG: outer membrane protein [Cellvibrio sp.]|jgi:OOP family OmpA-OmpF porin|nr:outer membrane protein [Cellvibrio sp.]